MQGEQVCLSPGRERRFRSMGLDVLVAIAFWGSTLENVLQLQMSFDPEVHTWESYYANHVRIGVHCWINYG